MWKSIYLRIIVLKFNMFLVKVSSWWNKKFIFNDLFLSSNYSQFLHLKRGTLWMSSNFIFLSNCHLQPLNNILFSLVKNSKLLFLIHAFCLEKLASNNAFSKSLFNLISKEISLLYHSKDLSIAKKISNCFLISLFFIHFTLPMYVSNELLLDRFFSPADDVRRLT